MRGVVAIPEDVADQAKIERLVEVLRKANAPMMIREIAEAMPTSLTTAGKYVDICQAAGIVSVKPYATTKQVSLVRSTGKGGAGVS
jgi:response regulator of citrate/malate metabolism